MTEQQKTFVTPVSTVLVVLAVATGVYFYTNQVLPPETQVVTEIWEQDTLLSEWRHMADIPGSNLVVQTPFKKITLAWDVNLPVWTNGPSNVFFMPTGNSGFFKIRNRNQYGATSRWSEK